MIPGSADAVPRVSPVRFPLLFLAFSAFFDFALRAFLAFLFYFALRLLFFVFCFFRWLIRGMGEHRPWSTGAPPDN